MAEIIKNRYEVIGLVQAQMCNPNGDPDSANTPRMDLETGRGIITDVAYKARMRQYVLDAYQGKEGMSILMRRGNSINRAIAEAALSVNETDKLDKKDNKKANDAAKFMANKYWDVRAFGGVLSTGLNAGQVQGAVQIAMSLSQDPIEVLDMTITRDCYAEGDFKTLKEYDDLDAKKTDDSKRTMGNKQAIRYGLYVFKATISANLAEKVGFTEDDLRVFLESVFQMYEVNPSSSKFGMSIVSPLFIFKHVGTDSDEEQRVREAKMGCASAQKLFNLLSINKKESVDYPCDMKDYDIEFNKTNVPAGVIVGIKEAAYAPIDWDFNEVESIKIK